MLSSSSSSSTGNIKLLFIFDFNFHLGASALNSIFPRLLLIFSPCFLLLLFCFLFFLYYSFLLQSRWARQGIYLLFFPAWYALLFFPLFSLAAALNSRYAYFIYSFFRTKRRDFLMCCLRFSLSHFLSLFLNLTCYLQIGLSTTLFLISLFSPFLLLFNLCISEITSLFLFISCTVWYMILQDVGYIFFKLQLD